MIEVLFSRFPPWIGSTTSLCVVSSVTLVQTSGLGAKLNRPTVASLVSTMSHAALSHRRLPMGGQGFGKRLWKGKAFPAPPQARGGDDGRNFPKQFAPVLGSLCFLCSQYVATCLCRDQWLVSEWPMELCRVCVCWRRPGGLSRISRAHQRRQGQQG